VNEDWLSFEGAGKVGARPPSTGARVEKGDLLLELELKKKAAKKLKKLRAAVKKADAKFKKAQKQIAKTQSKRDEIEAERNHAEQQLRELRPKSVLRRGGVSKRDLEKWRKIMLKANKKLSQLSKRERKPRAQAIKAEQKLDKARSKLREAEDSVSRKLLRAPFAGRVVEVRVAKGDTVKGGDKALLLRNNLVARIVFEISGKVDLQAGGQAMVTVGRGSPSAAKVVDVKEDGDKTVIEVNMVDPAGAFSSMEPTAFRLVKEVADPVFRLPDSAVITDAEGRRNVYSLWDGRAFERPVEVVSTEADQLFVRDLSGALKIGEKVVSSYVGEGGVQQIQTGAQVEIVR
jgi:multidrug efflux pump subunit AcrA (membrane-fusion protein)